MADRPAIEGGEFVPLGSEHLAELTRFCAACSDFFSLVEGRPGGAETAAELLAPLPDNLARATHHRFGIRRNDRLDAVVELLEGHPAPTEWFVGLLLLHPDARGDGLGAVVWDSVRAWMVARRGSVAWLIVQKQNPGARRFWERHGFTVHSELTIALAALESPAWKFRMALGHAV